MKGLDDIRSLAREKAHNPATEIRSALLNTLHLQPQKATQPMKKDHL
jgi:hypothetical protein